MKTSRSSSPWLFIFLLLFVILFVFFLYTFTHELGHALVGLLLGQSLTEFDASFWDLSAHVGLVGGQLTASQLAIRSAAGVALPLFIWTVFIVLIPRKGNSLLETLKLLSSLAVINTLLPWIVLPFLFMVGRAPSDDVTNFLGYSHMPPLALSALALLAYVGSWALFLARIDGLRNAFLRFRSAAAEAFSPGDRRTFVGMAAVLLICTALVFALTVSASGNTASRYSPPEGFTQVAQLDLSDQAHASDAVAQFDLDQPGYVGIFVVLQGINTTYFDLTVTGPDGYQSLVLHGEGYRAEQDGGLWQMNLPAGKYQVVLTSAQSPGSLSVYLRP